MLQTFLSYLILYGLSQNIMLNGAGTVVFQREKQYFSFRITSTLFLVFGIAISCTIAYFLETYVYSKFNMLYINATIDVLIVGVYNFIVSLIYRKNKRFNYYLYDNAFSYAYDSVFMLSIIFTINMSVPIAEFFIMLAVIVVIVFITSLVIGFFINCINRGYLNASARNIPARLFLLAIFSIIFYYLSLMVV